MGFDFSEITEADLDLETSGSWPTSVKIIALTIVFVATLGLGYYFVINDEVSKLTTYEESEGKLRYEYENKFRLAFNLSAYKEQMLQMEVQLAQMLKKLPATHETPGLLDDITFIATSSGLKIRSIRWGIEAEREFYTELPLYIDVSGSYHEFGKFVSDVANLPRIVSLHEFEVKKGSKEALLFEIVAKTYRYKGK